MKSVILCEGRDDMWLLGYLLHKWSSEKWKYVKGGKISTLYDIPTLYENSGHTIRKRDDTDDKLAIWSVGGKDNFLSALNEINIINTNQPEERLENIIFVIDRDQNEIVETMKVFQEWFKQNNWHVELKNNEKCELSYMVEDEKYNLCICPIIFPFSECGALETVLMDSFSNSCPELNYIVCQAKKYISELSESDKVPSYLNESRGRLKAEFSSVISVVNPTRSFDASKEILMSHKWEEYEVVKTHFELLNQIFIRNYS
ncbi:MAG: hypothetical protein LBE57_06070 [Methanosarcinales archaeon]|jgi:hypothetical protein|nr:hypothetical protein [Methanosarcinales archaeon]